MTQTNKTWKFSGSVYVGGQIAKGKWETETWAPTEKKARQNLQWRYRKDNDVPLGTNVTIHGTLTPVS